MTTLTPVTLDLVGMGELMKVLGVSRSRVWQMSLRPDFPAPVASLIMGSIWALDDVKAWADKRGRTLNLEALTTDVQAGDDSTP